MIDKHLQSVEEAVADIKDGSIIFIGGFGEAGSPLELIHALIDQGAKDLTLVNNNAGSGHVGLASLIENNRVSKMICSFPRTAGSTVFTDTYLSGKIQLELVPQGTLAERIRAGGAGIPAFFTPTTIGTPLSEGKEIRDFNGREYVLEYGLKADVALVKCHTADRYGNLIYNKTARNFNPVMAGSANLTIVQTENFVDVGDINPEAVITPSIYVDRVVTVGHPLQESKLIKEGRVYP